MPVVPSHRRFSVLTEGSALKLLLTPETRRLFPRKREREKRGEGNLQSPDVAFASVNLPMPLIQYPASCEHPPSRRPHFRDPHSQSESGPSIAPPF